MTICSDGSHMTPLFIVKGKMNRPSWLSAPDTAALLRNDGMGNACLASQANAWMNTDIFEQWCAGIFLPATTHRRSEHSPVILVMDNFNAHVDPDVLMALVREHVYIVMLPPHTSHLLQPLDVGIMQTFKHYLHRALHTLKTSRDHTRIGEEELIKLLFKRTILGVKDKRGKPHSVWHATLSLTMSIVPSRTQDYAQ